MKLEALLVCRMISRHDVVWFSLLVFRNYLNHKQNAIVAVFIYCLIFAFYNLYIVSGYGMKCSQRRRHNAKKND